MRSIKINVPQIDDSKTVEIPLFRKGGEK